MWKITLLSLATALLAVQGTYGSKLGVASSLREFLAELMEEKTGVCDSYCYVEIDGTRHFFPDQFVDRNNPCIVYICDNGRVRKDDISTRCQKRPCDGKLVYLPGVCCLTCFIAPEKPEVTPWSEWTPCSETCGQGFRARSRTCDVPPNAENVDDCAAEDLLKIEECNLGDCQVDCEWEYERCDPCSATCGTATRTCYPRVTIPAQFGGKDCPPFVLNRVPQQLQCTDLQPCEPVDCEWRFSCGRCSATCGSGTQLCTPIITQQPLHGGRECPEFVRNGQQQIQECRDLEPCDPVDCEWRFGPCGRCSATCGSGTQLCTPIITQQPLHGGRECPQFVRNGQPQPQDCKDLEPCEPEDCEWEYRTCGRCSATCGPAQKQCIPHITKPAKHGGRQCPGFVLSGNPQAVECENQPPCPPVDCKWRFVNCGPCSATCGDATQTCTPQITIEAENGGKECPEFVRSGKPQEKKCEGLKPCPVKCRDGEHVCVVKGVEVCVLDRLDPKKLCDCIVTEEDVEKRKLIDWDLDFVHNNCDNCRYGQNPNQEDGDGDSVGDICDNCVDTPNRDQVDDDYDQIGDKCDDRVIISPYNEVQVQEETSYDKKSMAAALMQKLLEMYYSE